MTLVELLVVITVQAVVLGAATSLLCYTLLQVAHTSAGTTALHQASKVMNDIGQTVRNSYSCTVATKNGVSGLRCKMPVNGSDTDGDGVNDSFAPSSFTATRVPSYGTTGGQRHWYYLADATGVFGTTGTILWRAVRTDDSFPTAADTDKNWSQYYLSGSRYPLVAAISFSVSTGSETTTVSLTASAAQNAPDRAAGAAASTDTQSVTLSRTLPWRTDLE